MKLIVLAGGYSDERDVSLSSGSKVANALMANGHKVLLIDLSESCVAKEFDDAYETLKQAHFEYQVPKTAPDLSTMTNCGKNGSIYIGDNVLSLCQSADAVFLALHGSAGENGKIQALFDLYQVNYTGSDYGSSLLAMDKLIAKQLVQTAGMLTPKWQMYTNDQVLPDFPCVVKPNSNGSSIGVSIVDNQAAFDAAIQQIDTNSDTILIEEKIEGREFSIGVLDNQALPVIEIIPKAGFYDYENKYQPDATEEIVPAHLSAAVTAKLQTMAVDAHQILGLGYYSRIDVMMDRNENLYFIEANSLPGMTPTSLLPQEAAAAGISYEALCELLIQHADYQA